MANNQCPKADALFTSDLSIGTNYLYLPSDLHHMCVGLTHTEVTCIVTMASAEIHSIDLVAEQQQSEATASLVVTGKPHRQRVH
jgi:hypothetical protein